MKIVLNKTFNASLVSRSQAKEVCNQLEEFKEVEIDFDGIQWMGQGFAHQIFVVFARKHLDIKLEPVNRSEDVAKMYAHVMHT